MVYGLKNTPQRAVPSATTNAMALKMLSAEVRVIRKKQVAPEITMPEYQDLPRKNAKTSEKMPTNNATHKNIALTVLSDAPKTEKKTPSAKETDPTTLNNA